MRYRVEYRNYLTTDGWQLMSQTYETYSRACTIATALENRGYITRVVQEP